jgi:hypothetical protein
MKPEDAQQSSIEKKYYTGAGNRWAHKEVLELMTKTARFLYFKGYILRTGGAPGPDKAFELGAGEKKEVYLPFEGFNKSDSKLFTIPDEAFKIAEKHHPSWENCKDHVKKIHARSVIQVLGLDLNTPSDFVICYTPNGRKYGGTGMVMRIAEAYEIQVFDLVNEEHKQRIIASMTKK